MLYNDQHPSTTDLQNGGSLISTKIVEPSDFVQHSFHHISARDQNLSSKGRRTNNEACALLLFKFFSKVIDLVLEILTGEFYW